MIVVNDKMYMYRKLIAVDAELNIKPETVIAHILAHSYQTALNMNVPVDFKCLYINCDSESYINGMLEISGDQLQAALNGASVNLEPSYKIETVNAWTLLDEKHLTEWYNHNQYLQVIVGPINLIPESVLQNILVCFHNSEIYLYGDPLIDSPEYYNHHMNYLTNTTLSLRVDYGVNRISDKKKLNNVLTKMRKDNMQLGDISINTSVSVNNDNNINYIFIKQYLEESPGSTVVVPRRLYPEMNSALYYDLYGTDNLDIDIMNEYLFRLPYLFSGRVSFINGESSPYFVLPIAPMTKFRVLNKYGTVINNYNNKEYLRVDIQLMDGTILHDLMIDLDDFMLQFHPELHPANIETFKTIQHMYETTPTYFEFDPSSVKICISRLTTSDYTKYFTSTKTLAYIELIERESSFGTDANWFKHFCKTLDEIDIIYCEEF